MAATLASSNPNFFKCQEPNCHSTHFATSSNLKRHMRSKHGPKVRMACGEERQNHSSNKKRHQSSCSKCKTIAAQQANVAAASESHDANHGDPTSFDSGTAIVEAQPDGHAAEINQDFFDVFCWTYGGLGPIYNAERWNNEPLH